MGDVGRRKLETMLDGYYATQVGAVPPEVVDGIVRMMLDEDARVCEVHPRHLGFAAFVATQVGFVPVWTWVVQVAIVVVMCAVAIAGADAGAAKLLVGILSAASVLVGIPTVHKSKLYGVAELEYSCLNNAATVMVARLIVLGCSSALAVLLMVVVTAVQLSTGAFAVALWATPPFFCSCAGCLFALRKAAPSMATALCVTWTFSCSAVLMVFSVIFPGMYAEASLAVWVGAALVAFVWLTREVAMSLRSTREGLDAFSPHAVRAYD